MGATEEQMLLVNSSGIDHVAYVLILYSLAFIVFLFANVLVHIFDRSVNLNGNTKGVNGRAHGSNGHTLAPAQERRLRDAEEFELDDIMSDEDEEDAQRRKLLKEEKDDVEREGDGLSSPSTVGRNNERVA
jgi:hypothetical protein